MNTPTEDTATDGANANAQFLLAQQDNLDNSEICSQSSVGVTDRCFRCSSKLTASAEMSC
jgi:hypothetical protein